MKWTTWRENACDERDREIRENAIREFARFLETTASPNGTVQREKLQSFATEFLGASQKGDRE